MKIFLTILPYIIAYTSKQVISLPDYCKPDCSNLPKPECKIFEIELRAALARCTSNYNPMIVETTTPCDVNQVEEPQLHKNSLKCTRKMLVTLKITNQGDTTITNQYIIVDHIVDGKTNQRLSLLNPYVIVLRQQPIFQLYGLKFVAILNGEVTETVINKRDPKFSGCDDSFQNPTCGKVVLDGKFIPYSQGFCCSCNSAKNVKRQSNSQKNKEEPTSPIKNIHEYIYNNTKPDNNIVYNNRQEQLRTNFKRHNGYYDFNNYLSRHRPKIMPEQMIVVAPKMYQNEELEDTNEYSSAEEDYPPKNIQTRGGQSCGKNDTMDESAHCAKLSNVWYTVYQISTPILEHTIYIKIFEKRERDNGGTDWFDITPGPAIDIGTLRTKYMDKFRTVQVKYYNSGPNALPIVFALDPKIKRLLVPRSSKTGNEDDNNIQIAGGPGEFLVVDDKDMNPSGDQCDTAGVGYKAFFNQPHRCSVPQGTCLKNQPNQMWRRNKMSCKRQNKGKHFLKNFARVPEHNAIRTTTQGNTKYLALHFDEILQNTLNIEVKIDDNVVFQNLPRAQITEVYMDGTSVAVTILIIKILNSGLISSTYHPRLSDCPLELPVDWSNLEGDPVVIPPQHHATFTMRLFGTLSIPKFYCTVEALNKRSEIIAVRRIRIVKGDRCICSWHCLCACLTTTGLGCSPMTLEHYKAAGFIGSMPLTTTMIKKSNTDHVLFGFCYMVILLSCILLILGFAKALIGLCYTPIGTWGLDMLIGVQPLTHYYESSIRNRIVVYDCEGWPIHPDTYQRTVRIIPKHVELCLNIIFFFTYPIMLLLIVSIKLCCPYLSYPKSLDADESNLEGVSTFIGSEYPTSKIDTDDSEDLDQFEFDCLSSMEKKMVQDLDETRNVCQEEEITLTSADHSTGKTKTCK